MRCLIINIVFKCERPNLLKNFVPVTIGDYIRQKRLKCGLSLKELSSRWAISTDQLFHWERGRNVQPWFFPMIFEFLEFKPLHIDTLSPTKRLIAFKTLSGITDKQLAKKLGLTTIDITNFEYGKSISKESERKITSYFDTFL